MAPTRREVFARFRLEIEDDFRAEFTHVDYRRWGILEVWGVGRVTGPQPKRQRREDRITVWLNGQSLGAFTSRDEAMACARRALTLADVDLSDVAEGVINGS